MRSLIPALLKAHRWLALIVSPFLLLIVLSGMVLAFKPILGGQVVRSVNVPRLLVALNKADPQGQARVMTVSADGTHFVLRSRAIGPSGTYDIQSGEKTGEVGFDIFELARNLHESLLVQANWLVTLVTVISVIVMISGFLLGWRTLRNTLTGWHSGLGWLAWPLAALTPVTGLLMALHLGMPRLPNYAAGTPQPIARSIEIASRRTDLNGLTMARSFRGGAVMLAVQSGSQPVQYLVPSNGQLLGMAGPGWVRMLHEGTWAGALSGWITLLSVFPFLGLLITGVYKWWLRSRRLAQIHSQA
jgi:sulfite reductase (NADPH) flavoprotein alpha-component